MFAENIPGGQSSEGGNLALDSKYFENFKNTRVLLKL